jgi:glycosyltransferase involved in cell wall biosynthesis
MRRLLYKPPAIFEEEIIEAKRSITSRQKLRLAIVVDQPFWFDGRTYTTNSPFLQELSFSTCFDEVRLFVPVQYSEGRKGKFGLDDSLNKNIIIHPLPFFERSGDVYRQSLKVIPGAIKVIWKCIHEWDIGCVVDYHIIGIIFFYISKLFEKKLFNYLRSDIIEEFKAHDKEGKKAFSYFLVNFLGFFARIRAKSSLTVVVGDELYSKYKQFGSDIFKFYPTRVYGKDILSKAEIKSHGTNTNIKLLTVGRLTPEKGLIYLLKALKIIREKRHKFVLSIVGDGKLDKELRNVACDLDLSDSVIFRGCISSKSELLVIYQDADIFLLPSLTEGIPKTLYEAMARGVPIIATSVGGVPNIIKDSENGLLVPPAKPEAMAEAILRLINDEELRIKLIKNGLETVREYTLEKQRVRIINILRTHFSI